MAQIKPYESRFSANSDTGTPYRSSRADASDFLMTSRSDETSRALGNLGETMIKSYDFLKQQEEEKEISQAQVAVAKARTDYIDTYNKRIESAELGDETLPPTVRQELNTTFTDLRNQFKTDKARKYVELHGESTTAAFFEKSISWQVNTAKEAAVNYHNTRVTQDLEAISKSPETAEFLLGGAIFDVENGVGRYKHYNKHPEQKARLIEQIKDQYTTTKYARLIESDPATVGQIAGVADAAVKAEIPGFGQKPIENFSAPYVKPYDDKKLQSRAKMIQMPSEYDVHFKAAGEKYGVPWQELKLKAVVESGLDPKAVNKESGAAGMMQFMPATAKEFGLQDPHDPVQAIDAAARKMKRDLSTSNGDTRQADMRYYGMPAKGKPGRLDSEQYASNSEALRYAAGMKEAPPVVQMPTVQKGQLPDDFLSLPIEKQLALTRRAEQLYKQNAAQGNAILKKTVEDHVAAADNGVQFTPLQPQAFAGLGAEAATAWAAYSTSLKVAEQFNTLKYLPADQQQAAVEAMRKPLGTSAPGTYAIEEKVLAQLENKLKTSNATRAKDPVQFALDSKFGTSTGSPIKPITAGKPDELLVQLEERFTNAQAVSDMQKVPFQLMSKAESITLSNHIMSMPAAEATNFLAQMRTGMSREKFREFTNAISSDSPGLRHIGTVMNSSNPQRDQVAHWVLAGMREMNATLPVEKGMSKPRKVPEQALELVREWLSVGKDGKSYTGEIAISPDAMDAMSETAAAAYLGMKMQKNRAYDLDLSKKDGQANRDEFKKMLDTVIGKPVQVGPTKVFGPYGMDEATFINSVKPRVEEQMPGLTWGSYGLTPAVRGEGKFHITVGGIATPNIIDISAPTQSSVEARRLLSKAKYAGETVMSAPSGKVAPTGKPDAYTQAVNDFWNQFRK